MEKLKCNGYMMTIDKSTRSKDNYDLTNILKIIIVLYNNNRYTVTIIGITKSDCRCLLLKCMFSSKVWRLH